MNSPRAALGLVVASLLAASLNTRAEAPKIDRVIELLHEAKDSAAPVPLLEKARATLKDFKPSSPLKLRAAHVGPRHVAGIEVGAAEHKHHAMEAITEAIETAKSGADSKSKIESAIAHVHQAGDSKH